MKPTAFRFDRYILDLARASLRRGEETIELRPKSFDVLRYLIENAGRVVTKDEIFAAVWQDVTVTDDSLVQCIREIRQALQDDAQRLVKTIQRRGYLFDAPVTPTTPADGATVGQIEEAFQVKVLLVDDHVLIRDALRSVLKELSINANVLEASDCRQALQLIKDHPDLRLILLDLNLPDSDGFSVLAYLRSRHPTMSTVVLSAFVDRDKVVRALDLGALGFIPKTAPREVMVNALRLVVSGGMYIPPEILARPEAAPERPDPERAVSQTDPGFIKR